MPEKADYSIVRRVGSTAVLINALYGTVDLINQAVLRAYQDDLEGLSGDEQAYWTSLSSVDTRCPLSSL